MQLNDHSSKQMGEWLSSLIQLQVIIAGNHCEKFMEPNEGNAKGMNEQTK